jgi:hypothetical protein
LQCKEGRKNIFRTNSQCDAGIGGEVLIWGKGLPSPGGNSVFADGHSELRDDKKLARHMSGARQSTNRPCAADLNEVQLEARVRSCHSLRYGNKPVSAWIGGALPFARSAASVLRGNLPHLTFVRSAVSDF